jgi:glutamine amidotransferase
MCDLFAISAGEDYSAPRSLPVFAALASKNMDGWGIGYYKKQRAFVEKSEEGVYVGTHVHDGFQRLARVVRSRIIISHVRFRTSGPVDECHAHPFVLRFCAHDWLFAHNGRAAAVESYRSTGTRLAGVLSDSARTFEYLRDRLISYCERQPGLSQLFEALCQVTAGLVDEYPGNYNFLLTNGVTLFAFTNHRQFMLLKDSKTLEGALLLTTVERGLSSEPWVRVARSTSRKGLMLMISGKDIILQQAL